MRFLELESDQYPSCCAIQVLFDFMPLYEEDDENPYSEKLDAEVLVDEEWWKCLVNTRIWGPIVTFANSSKANAGVFTPTKLATWLRKQGETVSHTRSIVNPNSDSKIVMYTWMPSKKFLTNYKKKQEDAANSRRGVAA